MLRGGVPKHFKMPWARVPATLRNAECRDFEPPAGYRCIECGEQYAPEPRPETQSYVRSSSAFTAEAGELYGSTFVKNGCGEYQSAKNREYKARSLAKKIAEAKQVARIAIGADWEDSE